MHPFLAVATLSGGLLAAGPAAAQDAAAIQAIQRQITDLQAQLKRLQAESARRDAELRQAQQEAAQARREAQSARAAQAAAAQTTATQPGATQPGATQPGATQPGATRTATSQIPPPSPVTVLPPGYVALPQGAVVVTQPANDKDAAGNPIQNPKKPNGTFNIGGVTITLGGYIEGTLYDRSRNENRGTSTSFGSIPFRGPTAQGDTGEFNISAQQTRLSLRTDADINASSSVTGYVETDFNNGAGGANSVQSNSYTPRLRQAFAEYADKPWQFYALAGQAWSLATPFRKGLDPFQTFQPPTIDNAYLVGYDYLRVPAARVVKGFGPVSLGLEINAPQTVFGGTAPSLTNATLATGYAGNGGLNPQATYSVNTAPDLIGKAAIDTSFGHYEVFGLLRQFQDQVSYSLNGATNTRGGESNYTSTGGGIGGALFIPVMNYADIQGNFLTGSGVGRYGAGGLPDVTYAGNGSPVPLHETMFDAGVVGHVLPSLDLYVFGGIDQIGKSTFGSTVGYGNPGANNAGCFNPNAGSGCTGNNYQLSEITAGYDWRFLTGPFGTLQTGLQYAYAVRQAYGGNGGAPSAIDNMIFANLRYTPFQ